MVTIEPNKLVIEFEDVIGLEADTLHRIHYELVELLQCALILNESGIRKLESAYYGTMGLLKAIAPSFDDVAHMECAYPSNCAWRVLSKHQEAVSKVAVMLISFKTRSASSI